MVNEWNASVTGSVSRASIDYCFRFHDHSLVTFKLLGWELVQFLGVYDHPIPIFTCYSRMYSHILGVLSIQVPSMQIAAMNDSICWEVVLGMRMMPLL